MCANVFASVKDPFDIAAPNCRNYPSQLSGEAMGLRRAARAKRRPRGSPGVSQPLSCRFASGQTGPRSRCSPTRCGYRTLEPSVSWTVSRWLGWRDARPTRLTGGGRSFGSSRRGPFSPIARSSHVPASWSRPSASLVPRRVVTWSDCCRRCWRRLLPIHARLEAPADSVTPTPAATTKVSARHEGR
jgi:hypothetical protein